MIGETKGSSYRNRCIEVWDAELISCRISASLEDNMALKQASHTKRVEKSLLRRNDEVHEAREVKSRDSWLPSLWRS